MVNLYDSPAQAQFVNTYVPIQFDAMYKLADKSQKDLDQAQATEDELISNYSTINTPIIAHRDEWNKSIYAPVKDLIDNKIQSTDDMKDPMIQAELKSMLRKLKANPRAAELLQSAQNAKEFIKKSDPRWGGEEARSAINYAGPGVFEAQNVTYQDFKDMSKPYTDQIEDSYLYTKGGYDYSGKSAATIQNAINMGAPEIKSNPAARMHFEMDKKSGAARKYAKVDIYGNESYDNESYDKYVKDMSYAANQDMIKTKVEANEFAKLNAQYNMQVKLAKLKGEITKDGKAGDGNASATTIEVANALKAASYQREALVNDAYDKLMSNVKMFGGKMIIASDMLKAGITPSEVLSIKTLTDQYTRLKGSGTEQEKSAIQKLTTYEQQVKNKMAAHMDIESNRNNRGSFGKTAREISASMITDISGLAADNLMLSRYGKDSKMSMADGQGVDKKTVYKTTGSRNYSVIDNESGAAITNPVAKSLNALIKGGTFDKSMFYSPTTRSMIKSADAIDILGYVYIPAKIIENNASLIGLNPESIDSDLKKKTGAERVSYKLDANNAAEFYAIPVKSDGLDINNANRGTFDNLMNNSGFGVYDSQIPQ